MLGIIIGVSSVILLVSIGTGLKNYIVEQFESLGANTIMIVPGEMTVEVALQHLVRWGKKAHEGGPFLSSSENKGDSPGRLTESPLRAKASLCSP